MEINRETLTPLEDYIEALVFKTFRPYFSMDEDVLADIMVDLIDEIMDTVVTECNGV